METCKRPEKSVPEETQQGTSNVTDGLRSNLQKETLQPQAQQTVDPPSLW
jgi:hypothetical protein